MKLSQFRFDLPLNLIAQNPTKRREDSRMMVIHRKTGEIENRNFRDIIEYFDDKDVMVVNNTKVFPARMYGRKEKTGAKIEVPPFIETGDIIKIDTKTEEYIQRV